MELAALAEQYHESVRQHETDVLALDVPKLRRPLHIPHGVVEAYVGARDILVQ